jgi:hypothetical protein
LNDVGSPGGTFIVGNETDLRALADWFGDGLTDVWHQRTQVFELIALFVEVLVQV